MRVDFKKSCLNKKTYTKREASATKNYRRKKGTLLRVYQCPLCNLWHLTKKI